MVMGPDSTMSCFSCSTRSAPWHCLRVSILTVLQLRRFVRAVLRSRSTAARCFSQQRQPVVRALHQQTLNAYLVNLIRLATGARASHAPAPTLRGLFYVSMFFI
jgi:hypothetical protein